MMVVTVVDLCGREKNDGGRDRPLLATAGGEGGRDVEKE